MESFAIALTVFVLVITSYSIHYTKLYENGFESCKQIRQFSSCPILMLTAKGEDYDQIEGFDCGADDYVIKPFTPMVLEARIKALLRRTNKKDTKTQFGRLKIDEAARQVWIGEAEVVCNRKEFDLLYYLANNDRITSYNVCYTKLLRPASGA